VRGGGVGSGGGGRGGYFETITVPDAAFPAVQITSARRGHLRFDARRFLHFPANNLSNFPAEIATV